MTADEVVRKEGIRILVATLLELSEDRDAVVQTVAEKYNISTEEVKNIPNL